MNGNNEFGVSYSRIAWLEQALPLHENVLVVDRDQDIVFRVKRKRGPKLQIVCLDEYACGIGRVYEGLAAFPGTNFIYVGGNWNGYTTEAKEYCLENRIGLYNSTEITGAIHRDDYWSYHKKDRDGNPAYSFNNR